MGIIKRALRRTSRKILSKLIPPAHTHQLVLNPQLQGAELQTDKAVSSRKLSSLQRKLRKYGSSKDTAVAEALLLAVKNHLPPLQFHHVHGPHAQLGQNRCVARRTQSFCQALVFSNRVILPNERVYIKVLEISKCWSGTIRFGFTAVDPATLACRMPKHVCPDMTNAGHTWARALADDVVRRNSVIHFSYTKNGIIHYGINNQDCGIFHANVSTSQNLWFIVDIYGLTAAVELIDPRVNIGSTFSAGSVAEMASLAHIDDVDGMSGDDLPAQDVRLATMYKSTGAMEELFGSNHEAWIARLRRKQQSRKQARQQAALMRAASNWPLEMEAASRFHQRHNARDLAHQSALQLPNLSALAMPSAQQNIYSPMPNYAPTQAARRGSSQIRAQEHDYHQIMSATHGNVNASSPYYHPLSMTNQAKLSNSLSLANIAHQPTECAGTPSTTTTSPSNSFAEQLLISNQHQHNGTPANQHQTRTSAELSRQLENMHLHDKRSRQQAAEKTQTSACAGAAAAVAASQVPVAATRKRLQQQPINVALTNFNRSPTSSRDRKTDNNLIAHRIVSSKSSTTISATPSTSASISRRAAVAQATVKPKARHSMKNSKSALTTARDNNEDRNGSTNKADCPICFERPINCVLYQCGHMCTCYQCGVRQWKTGSRTCPICRAIIKDVIKTYKS